MMFRPLSSVKLLQPLHLSERIQVLDQTRQHDDLCSCALAVVVGLVLRLLHVPGGASHLEVLGHRLLGSLFRGSLHL
jgi:hypothetical protein